MIKDEGSKKKSIDYNLDDEGKIRRKVLTIILDLVQCVWKKGRCDL